MSDWWRLHTVAPTSSGLADAIVAALAEDRHAALRAGALAVYAEFSEERVVSSLEAVFRNAVVAESWGGMIDVMPDAIPVISPVESLPGFFIATGFSGHGFGIGPGAGKLVADMVAGDPTLVDPAPFRISRFTDGSNPRPHPLAS